MAKKSDNPPFPGVAQQRPRLPARKARLIVRSLAKRTVLAAGFAVTQLSIPEVDSRFQVFDPPLVDRLQAPITRYHE